MKLKGSTFLQSSESPGMALYFRKVEELKGELKLAGGRKFKNSCLMCAIGICSAAGGGVSVLLAVEGTHQLQGAQPGRGQMERDVLFCTGCDQAASIKV